MKLDLNVDVHHLTRVEGHGNIHVRVVDGELAQGDSGPAEDQRENYETGTALQHSSF